MIDRKTTRPPAVDTERNQCDVYINCSAEHSSCILHYNATSDVCEFSVVPILICIAWGLAHSIYSIFNE